MAIMTPAKFHFNWLMLTLIFGIWASEPPPPPAWRTTEKAGPDRVKLQLHYETYRLRFYSNSLIHILSLSNSRTNVASIQKNRSDKSHRAIVTLGELNRTIPSCINLM